MTIPLLVIAIGNESRGDDALAPLLIRQLQSESGTDQIEFIEDFQLQVEHVTDLVGRTAVLFIDADMSCEAPFHFSAITAAQDNSYTSHAMTPFAVLHTFKQVYGTDAPPCYLLRLRGYGFELGDSLSPEATANLEQAAAMAQDWLAQMAANLGGLSG
ncbi:MAG: Ni/Fe hydrogenase [Sideroxydans sp. GWF2_59_14]|nr:MAG: Ni/Fe hydrogenase [Sideroxydans sp. GWF2_59_14]HAF43907.1 Ni/Fe hydrogenase [Gallionellaceae bacterium]